MNFAFRSRRLWLLALMTALVLFAVWLRMRYLVSFVEWPDEIRTLWRTQGTFDNFLARNPPDWPPTYGALMWGWVRVAGSALESSRIARRNAVPAAPNRHLSTVSKGGGAGACAMIVPHWQPILNGRA